MKGKTEHIKKFRGKIIVLAVSSAIFVFFAGCGSGSDVTMTGGTEAEQAAILEVLDTDAFFVESSTETDEDEDGASASQAQLYVGQISLQSLSAKSGSADLPRFWWRGDLERLGRKIEINIENGIANVKVSHDIAGTFFIADEVGDVLVLWGKPFEDLVTRYARFTKEPRGWKLSAISPVEFALANGEEQTVYIEAFKAYSGDELVWEATDPASLYTLTSGLPIFTSGDEIRVEATISNTSESGWEPSQFVFLHRPGPHITGRRTRDIMFDDGTNGDLVAGDGIYTRVYTIGPCRGRHFAAVDAIDAATFMELEAPYNSGAWGMPYIVE